jgi:hypothetical protein
MSGAPASLFDNDFQSVIDADRDRGVQPPTLTSSPADGRDQWILVPQC